MGLRRATVDDAERIAQVHVASFRSAFRGIFPDSQVDGFTVARRMPGLLKVLWNVKDNARARNFYLKCGFIFERNLVQTDKRRRNRSMERFSMNFPKESDSESEADRME